MEVSNGLCFICSIQRNILTLQKGDPLDQTMVQRCAPLVSHLTGALTDAGGGEFQRDVK